MESLIPQIAIPAFLILLGLIFGRVAEMKHRRNLERREQRLRHMIVSNLKTFPGGSDPAHGPTIVMGDAVIATDYVKSLLAKIRMTLGGEVRSFESLMVRARREAIMRMLERAEDTGYDAVCNVRLNPADIGGVTRRRPVLMASVCATGTAYRTAQDSPDDHTLQ